MKTSSTWRILLQFFLCQNGLPQKTLSIKVRLSENRLPKNPMLYQLYHEIIGSRIFGPTDPFFREFHSIYSHVHQWIKASSQLAPTNIQWSGLWSQLCLPPRQKKSRGSTGCAPKGPTVGRWPSDSWLQPLNFLIVLQTDK